MAGVFDVLSDETRLAIVQLLLDGELRTAGQIADLVSMPTSTCSYHLSKLLSSGITVCRVEGTRRFPVLRRSELENEFPGLLELIRIAPLPVSRAH
ncbi:ArsR/SmtB family transcription factor [Mycolicibacterium mengxianglii]|uniref:ArsR/SmtB family transcription factor n=1 Tax=Mycolicibacterium mengxianglii TaxID=2736649 RepID=UPI0018EED310|nr:metalloregulator ArsR/SmtB family transcription factor [Mycolicibacterium mengxianglii]